MYAKFFKRIFDFFLSLIALIILSPLMMVLMIVGAIIMKGNPFFTQLRPGKDEKIFRLIKFRTMTNERDESGKLLPDEVRLVPYGKWLRSTSLDELPELINILVGDLAIVGPRPQLVRDMVFMTPEQRRRHTVRQGLTGLAQCSGRNNMSWERKFEYDLEYIEKITLIEDLKILLMTVFKVFKRDGITEEGMATAEDLGDHLLRSGAVDQDEYDRKQAESRDLILKK
ncbi:MAG: sugar transferase [Clostridia bacterium]|nr:sugar transferase [Clostridia bacterium]